MVHSCFLLPTFKVKKYYHNNDTTCIKEVLSSSFLVIMLRVSKNAY
ncbi:hypothetical protein PAUR_b1143 [Pseudoalteromonas aurantia 208]|uniref:Uncharacterized protein n=1 Tax=Pseudoalteromonas aurantia 208 TaxID=1314867 RepID=A0ABR9EJ15_9GAMM|nr:hypothetical protein [Pseudoalteromonas aurantia 208]